MALHHLSLIALAAAAGLRRRSEVPGFDYDTSKIQGVNLGGWLVTEPFITPSLYSSVEGSSPVDEYHLSQALGDSAQSVFQEHWDTWITEDDIETIAGWGMNTVRIPIGYWAFLKRDQDPYVQGQEDYLDKAIGWARTHGIKVWVDLHGVPGSQNGFDNSGLRDSYDWLNEAYPENLQGSYDVLDTITAKYAGSDYYDVIIGIELVNEPLGSAIGMSGVESYYQNGYGKVRNYGSQGVVVQDAFQDVGYFNDMLQVPDYWNVVLDHHHYQIFSIDQVNRTFDEQMTVACEYIDSLDTENLWKVVGEWSAALTDCQPLLNGVGHGARYDATYESTQYVGSCDELSDISNWSSERKEQTRRFVEAQLDGYERGAGWIIWTYKTEDGIEWDTRRLIENGLFPMPLSDRQYSNPCT